MAIILCIETSTSVCSVAISIDGECVAFKEIDDQKSHSSQLSILVDEVCAEANITYLEIDAVAISKGPGSYTGLRIGTSVAKGILYAIDKPMIAIDTLKAMANGVVNSYPNMLDEGTLLCPMIDARRMEVYNAFYTSTLESKSDVAATIIEENTLDEVLNYNNVLIFGTGSEKCKTVFKDKKVTFIDNYKCSSRWMTSLAEKQYIQSEFVDSAYFEPFYLKEFQATVSKKSIF